MRIPRRPAIRAQLSHYPSLASCWVLRLSWWKTMPARVESSGGMTLSRDFPPLLPARADL